MPKPLHVAIVYPSGDMLHAQFCGSLVNLVAYSSSIGIQVSCINPKCSLVQIGRFMGIETAIDNGADKVLFIDSDQTFSHDALQRLLASGKDIIGAASLTRKDPIQYTCKDEQGERINFREKTGLVEVHTNGFPLTLIDCKVFDKIEKPYFPVSYNPETNRWTGEDESFCHAARERNELLLLQ